MKEKKSSNIVGSFSYPSEKEEIMKELRIIAAREGKSQSNIICDIIEEYVKNHLEGNSTFKIDNWVDNSEFKALPALLSPKEKWDSYLEECSNKECTDIAIMSKFIFEKINRRRTQEFTNQKDNDPIYQYLKKEGKL